MSQQVTILTSEQIVEVTLNSDGDPIDVVLRENALIVQIGGTRVGTVNALNFIQGTGITISFTNDADGVTGNLTINASLSSYLLAANNLSDVANAATARANLSAQGLIISETALVSGATIDIAQQNNTLATALTAITFTISNTSTFIYLTITLTGTALTLTFPTNTLCVREGTASGDNTCALSGVSGDVYEIAIKKRGATYSVISKNMGQ